MDSYVQRLHGLLQQATSADTAAIKNATTVLNTEYYRDSNCIPALFEIVKAAPEQPLRQFAAVELRKRVAQRDNALWTALAQNLRESLKTQILAAAINEPASIVRHSIARVIAAVAESDVTTTGWPALLPWLNETTSAGAPTPSKETGIFVLYTCLETLLDAKPDMINEMFAHFVTLLSDPSSLVVRTTAFRTLIVIAQYIDASQKKELASFRSVVPQLIAVTEQSIAAGDVESYKHAIDGFETLSMLEAPFLTTHLTDLISFCVRTGADKNIDADYRIYALNALAWLIKYKKSKIQNSNLVPQILEALLIIGSEEEPEDLEDDAPARTAFRVVDALACNLPPSLVFNPLYELVKANTTSSQPELRKSALTCLGLAVEGCSEYIRPQINQLWPFIDQGLQDPSPLVRNAACISFGCFCEYLPEECTERHEFFMNALMTLFADRETQQSACTALDAFLEVLGDQIASYMPAIMERLSSHLESATTRVKISITGAIGSAAHAAGPAFLPYFSVTLSRLQAFFTKNTEDLQPDELELKAIAMDTLGTMADAVGKDVFRAYFADSMKVAFESLDTPSQRLKECAFLLFAHMAKLFEADFVMYLETVVPALIASCAQLEAGEETALKAAEAALGTSPDAFSTGGSITAATDDTVVDMDEEDPTDLEKALEVNSAIAIEKEIAAEALGTIFASVGEAFLPYLEKAVEELENLLEHYYEGIRKSAIGTLFEFINTFHDLSKPEAWVPGFPASVPLHEKVAQLDQTVMKLIIEAWNEEDDKSVVSNICENLAESIAKQGPGFIQPYLEQIGPLVLQILERKALCQQDPDEDDEDEISEEQAEYETVLVSAAMDVVGAIAQAGGPAASDTISPFMEPLLSYLKRGRSSTDRSASIGTLGEIISGLRSGVTAYTQPLLPFILGSLTDSEYEVQSNAAFALGELIEMSETDLSSQYLQFLMVLRSFFEIPSSGSGGEVEPAVIARDNAVGAVSRMIVKNMPAEQIEQVLPTLVSALPLRKDFLENKALFRAIFHVYSNEPRLMTPYLPQLLTVFAHVLDPSRADQIGDDIRAQLIQLVRALNAQHPSEVSQAGLSVFL